MKIFKLLVGLTLITSGNVVASEALTEQDLMSHYVADLESKVIGKPVDLYNINAVFEAVKKHRQYLMLCSHQFASSKCKQATLDLEVLGDTLAAHTRFQNDLSEMSSINKSITTPPSSKDAEKWEKLMMDYYKSLACGHESETVDQACIERFNGL
ncbi:hypothetical protein [Vibrio coralliilyticus]|uniref:Uncharacterized protein n=1 Tax=Vibrio coralliilyticus TaxID=190893 RepID=A0AAP6ZNL1_9VIBR|nr:hypothetical protein [Vibrio coralliilyticus]NOI32033.1 hypothetical protein [Vibrio coralliilyticus]NOJ25234.1 hypothetical protein [Vibrio coralliilyticus]